MNKKQAKGVEFEYKGQVHNVKARHEIIMSAGTINTAQLLMLSGIGPRNMLQKLNVSYECISTVTPFYFLFLLLIYNL